MADEGLEVPAAGGHRLPIPTTWHMGSAPQPLPLTTHRRFFKSPHFDGWYRQRHKEMVQKLEALHLEAICEAVRGLRGKVVEVQAQGRGWGSRGTWAQGWVRALVMDSPILSQQNIEAWMKDKSEVEIVDLVLKLREKLVRCLPALPNLGQLGMEVTCP